MAYVSLYRKYRPQTFDEVVGQDHVTRTLVNAIAEERLHHAYLFTGPRGTGKTSTARILAKALNCEAGPTPTPCNACDQCVAITAGSSVDVVELDMASHGGVDDARELRDRALFAPASGRKKVYILDEVHMASTAAFNALLKLIEEPPGHVVFAMATTDPQKVLPTIMSRVQRFDLRRVAATEVAAHVRRLCEAEGYTIDDGAVDAVVRAGDGSVRDTLSVLEQVLAFAGTDVTAEAVAQVLGQTPVERTFETVDLVAARDLAGLMGLVQGLLDDGHDLRRFAFDLVQHLRDLLVLQVAPDRPDLVDATDDHRARLAEQAGLLGRDTLLRAVEVLADTLAEMRQGPPRMPLELALAKLAVPATAGDLTDLADRLSRLEQRTPGTPADPAASQAGDRRSTGVLSDGPEPTQQPEPEVTGENPREAGASGKPSRSPQPPEPTPTEPPTDPAPSQAVSGKPPRSPQPPEPTDDLARIQKHWDAILETVKDDKRRFHAVFEPAEPVALKRRVLTLRYPVRYRSFHAENARKGEFAASLRDAIEQACGLKVKIDVQVEGDSPRRPQPPVITGGEDGDGAEAADPDEEAAVREAEYADDGDTLDPYTAASRAAELLRAELDAEPLDEPSDASG